MEFRTRYTVGPRVSQDPGGPSRTKQSMKDECDINRIIDRYTKTGVVTHIDRREPMFGDFSGVEDLHGALIRAEEARKLFRTLPAKLREKFDNNPIAFLEYAASSSNEDLRSLGLEETPAPDAPVEAKPEGVSP